MNDNFILSLVEKFSEGSVASLELRQGDDYILLRKKEAITASQEGAAIQAQIIPSVAAAASSPQPAQAASPAPSAAQVQAEGKSGQSDEAADLVQIKSPIVGTFYRSPSPDSPAYVEEGSAVKKGDPLCVIEAMKMMNPLESEFDCTIEKILVQNRDLVEYEQPLFLVRKAK